MAVAAVVGVSIRMIVRKRRSMIEKLVFIRNSMAQGYRSWVFIFLG